MVVLGTVTVRVELAPPPGDRDTLGGVRVGPRSKENESRVTEPENPSLLARSILELSDAPGAAVSSVFSADSVKSGPVTCVVIRADCERVQPLEAVMMVV